MFAAVAISLFSVVQAGTLAVTWEDCGATHAQVDDLQPTSIVTGGATTLVGSGVVDEDVTSAQFSAVIKALGIKISSCSGDATSDITCNLPAGAGEITVKAVSYPLTAGPVKIPVEVKTSALIPASLAKVDVHIQATEQNGESVICLDVHTQQQYDQVPKINGNTTLFVIGFLEGILSNQTDPFQCGIYGDLVFTYLQTALNQTKHGDIGPACQSLAEALDTVPDMLPYCKNAKDDVVTLLTALKQLTPAKAEEHIAARRSDLLEQVAAALEGLATRSYDDVGTSVGTIVRLIVEDDPAIIV